MSDRAVLFDYAGVMTHPVGRSFRDFERAAGLPKGTVFTLLRDAYTGDDGGAIGALERGELSVAELEAELAARFAADGVEVTPEGIVGRLFAGIAPDPAMWDLVARLRALGIATALLSNSWGVEAYPRERFATHFDTVVISGEVGVRKPDLAIFRLAADRLGVAVTDCVFVDDLDRNVDAATRHGLTAVLHRDAATTTAAIAAVLGLDLVT